MHAASEGELADTGENLRGPEQHADGDDHRRRKPEALEDREKLRRQRRRHERVGREGGGDQDESEAPRRQYGRRLADHTLRRRRALGMLARQGKSVQWRGDERKERGIDEISPAPANRAEEKLC